MPETALLFDLDGTLVDSIADLAAALNLLRSELGLMAISTAEVRQKVGDGARKLVQRTLPEAYHGRDRMLRFLELYSARLTTATHPYPGVVDLLEHLGDRPMAVVSNKPVAMTRQVLENLDLARFFPVQLGGDSCAEKKPHPRPVLEALARLGVEPDRAIMIGDHHTDLIAGHQAGCRTCFCSWGYGRTGKANPDWRVDSVAELNALLAGLRP